MFFPHFAGTPLPGDTHVLLQCKCTSFGTAPAAYPLHMYTSCYCSNALTTSRKEQTYILLPVLVYQYPQPISGKSLQ